MNSRVHTVIYTHGGGRLGNQVMRFAHWMAWVREHVDQVEVLNFAFWPYAEYFEVWRHHPGCVFPIRAGWADWLAKRHAALPRQLREKAAARNRIHRIVQSAGNWWPGCQAITLDIVNEESLDLNDPNFLARIANRSVTTCCGWKIASWKLIAEHQSELRRFFRPASSFADVARAFITDLRTRYDFLVGVLVRQGDYREWNEGRFYFSTAQYVEWIRQILDLHIGRNVAFVVASEEWQDAAAFAGLPVHFATGNPKNGGHWFEDWVELSLCDLVVSPPSTFSATAVFLRGVPLWPVDMENQIMNVGQLISDGMIGAAQHPMFSCAVK